MEVRLIDSFIPINLKTRKCPGLLTIVFWLQSITFIPQQEKKMIFVSTPIELS